MTDTPPSIAADLATQHGVLPLRKLHLIGVTGAEGARRALLRAPSGQIQTVQVGDTVRTQTIVAIDVDAVILSGRQGAQTLHMPDPVPARAAA